MSEEASPYFATGRTESPASFGAYIRAKREALLRHNSKYTVRKFAEQLGIQPSYISRIEREDVPPPSEETIIGMALLLQEDPDVLLAMAGKVSAELRQAIIRRPRLFSELIRHLKDAPDQSVLSVVREARAEYGRLQENRYEP